MKSRSGLLLAAVVCSLTSSLTLARADVRIVAPTGAPYSQIQAAVDAANPGDTILVRAGSYMPVTIDAKALIVCAEVGSMAHLVGPLVVKNLASGSEVVLSGLRSTGATSMQMSATAGVALHLANNSGPVRAQGCEFIGANGFGDGANGGFGSYCCDLPLHDEGWDGALLENNPAGVVFSACTLRGGRGAWAYLSCICGTGGPGGDGLRCVGSLVALYDCSLAGARGGDNGGVGGPGGAGARTQTGTFPTGLFASGSTFQGGRGGDGYDYVYSEGGAGGYGLLVLATTAAQVIDDACVGGLGGQACFGAFPPGPDGVGINGSGHVSSFNAPRVLSVMSRAVDAGSLLPIAVTGTPGEDVRIFIADDTSFHPLPSWRGVLVPAVFGLTSGRYLGTIPPSGTLGVSLALTSLRPGTLTRTLHVQVSAVGASTGITLGSPTTVTIFEPGL